MEENTIVYDLTSQAANRPDKRAITDKRFVCSYQFIELASNKIANFLFSQGIKKGDRVLCFTENSWKMVVFLYGVLKAGAIIVPVNPKSSWAQVRYIADDCSPVLLLADEDRINLTGLPLNCDIVSSEDEPSIKSSGIRATWGELMSFVDKPSSLDVKQQDLAAIIYTSGSTGGPRGVVSKHSQIHFATSAINKVIGNSENDVILCGLPFSFDYGLYQLFLAFNSGGAVVIEKNFSFPSIIPNLIDTYLITGLPCVPSLISMILRSKMLERVKLPSLRYISSTGDVLPPKHIRQIGNLLPNIKIFSMYGLTECKRVSIMPPKLLAGREDSVGLPLPGTEIYVVDENGNRADPGSTGELVVRGPHVMENYWNNPEDSSKKFRKDSNGNKVLFTGDKFRIDDYGFMYFLGREDTLIKSRGYRISSVEIENVLCELPTVSEAAAVGVPDDILGERIIAFVSINDGSSIDNQEMFSWCKDKLPSFSIPNELIIWMEPLPKTANGKIDRNKLKIYGCATR